MTLDSVPEWVKSQRASYMGKRNFDAKAFRVSRWSAFQFVWQYYIVYFIQTTFHRNPHSLFGWDVYLFDRFLLKVIPITWGSKRIGKIQKAAIVFQLGWAILSAGNCFRFHVSAIHWTHDSMYTLFEIIQWSQIPLWYSYYLLSAVYATRNTTWLYYVRGTTWLLMFYSIVVCGSFVIIPFEPGNIMDNSWEDRKDIYNPYARVPWLVRMHRPLECCGIRSPNDWLGTTKNFHIPNTCCPFSRFERNCTLSIAFDKPCGPKVGRVYRRCVGYITFSTFFNVVYLGINYQLFRYLFKRNEKGWQVEMSWKEALFPVLPTYKRTGPAVSIPLVISAPRPEKKRLTESQAVAAAIGGQEIPKELLEKEKRSRDPSKVEPGIEQNQQPSSKQD